VTGATVTALQQPAQLFRDALDHISWSGGQEPSTRRAEAAAFFLLQGIALGGQLCRMWLIPIPMRRRRLAILRGGGYRERIPGRDDKPLWPDGVSARAKVSPPDARKAGIAISNEIVRSVTRTAKPSSGS